MIMPQMARDRAISDLQCPSADLRVESISNGVYRADGCGRSAVYICHTGACILERPIERTAEPRPVAPTSGRAAVGASRGTELPAEIAGFRLGSTVGEAESVCVAGGATFSGGLDQGRFRTVTCSASPVAIEFVHSVTLALCGERICGVLLSIAPASDEDAAWTAMIEQIGGVLGSRYGQIRVAVHPTAAGETCPHLDVTWAAVRSGRCRVGALRTLPNGDVQLRVVGSDGTLRGAIQYRSTEMSRATGMVGGEHL